MLTAERVQRHRNALRELGLKPMQIWVYDTKRPNFLDECKRQCFVVSEADKLNNIHQFMEEALIDVDGWTN